MDSTVSAAESPIMDEAEAAKAARRSLRPLTSLLPYLGHYRWWVSFALVALAAAALATLALPVAVRRMIDFGFGEANAASPAGTQLIDSYFLVMFAVVGVLALASAFRYYLVTTLGERVVTDLRQDVFSHLLSLSPAFFDAARSGEILSRLSADTTQIKAAVGASVSVALRNIAMFIGAVAMMVITSPRLSAFVVGAIPIIILPLVAFGRAVRARSRHAQDMLAQATAEAGELLEGVRVVQAYTFEPVAIARFRRAVERAFDAAQASTISRAVLTAIAIFLVFASIVVVLWVGAQDVAAGAISAGRLGQFVLYAVLAGASLSEISQIGSELAATSGAAERLFEILKTRAVIAPPAQPAALPAPSRGAVEFSSVSFAYPQRPELRVLDNVSLAVKPGEKVAIVGPSGAGKSTLFHLLLRFYDPLAGTVSFDGLDLRRIAPAALRAQIALVPQESVIFAASLADNIRFGRPEASEAEVERAAALAHAAEFIARLPMGLATPVGERGVMLSGGQKQRIAIARAILRDAPLLLLDEATSSLDAESETLVKAALDDLMKQRTTLVIAHRLATVLSCDRIIVLDQGRIVEQGTHAELAAAGGLYSRLARMQFGKTPDEAERKN